MTFSFKILFVAILSLTVSKTTIGQTKDSSRVLLAMNNATTTKSSMVIRKANVVLPDIFKEHKDNAESYIREYAGTQRNNVITLYKKSQKYFPKAKLILKKHGIPSEFLALMAIESGFNSKAVSYAGAVGWWQFMDATAKGYGLNIIEGQTNAVKKDAQPTDAKTPAPTDDRWNLTKSSNAAARYLKDSYRVLGDWLLVAASYNCGVGRVKSAMAACGKSNPTFWDVKPYLPGQTKAYVMKFIALNTLFKNYNAFSAQDLIFDDITKEVEVPVSIPAPDFEQSIL